MKISVKKSRLLCMVICILIALFVSQKEIRAKTPAPFVSSESLLPSKNIVKVDGFRSAQFGMTEKEVLKTVFRDFRIPKSKIKRSAHPNEKTVNFNFQLKNLLMREFYRIVEKSDNAKIHTIRKVAPHSAAIR